MRYEYIGIGLFSLIFGIAMGWKDFYAWDSIFYWIIQIIIIGIMFLSFMLGRNSSDKQDEK